MFGALDEAAAGALLGVKDPVYKPGQHTMDPYQVVSQLKEVQIKEVFSAIEATTAMMGQEVEMANKYRVLVGDRLVFFGLEETNCCARLCQRGICCWAPSWNLSLRPVTPAGEAEDAFALERESGCTFLCWGRPQVRVKDVRTDKVIATLTEPCSCCHLNFNIQDDHEQERYRLQGHGCQLGLCCPLPCGPCSRVEFEVLEGQEKKVGTIVKKVPNCCTFLFAPDVDNYHVELADIQDAKMKIALLALVIFVDFRFFNNNSNDDMRRQGDSE